MNKTSTPLPLPLLAAALGIVATLWCGCAGSDESPKPDPAPLGALLQRQGLIRVNLQEYTGAHSFWVQSPGGLRFPSPGGPGTHAHLSDSPIRVEFRPTASDKAYWRLVARRYRLEERQEALRLAAAIEGDLGVQVEVLEEPYRSPWPSKPRPDDAHWIVTFGRFTDRRDAERALALFPEFQDAEIFFDRHRGLDGLLALFHEDGGALVELPANSLFEALEGGNPVLISPSRPGATTAPAKMAAYRGALQFLPENDGTLLPVNTVQIEDYLLSVVPSEIGDFAPEEALRAQAIAARSEAICKLNWGNRHADDRYDFVSGQLDQVYVGASKETDRCTAAVQSTRGQVLLHAGTVIDAVYSHSCGGKTADSEDIWPGAPVPYLRSVVDYTHWIWNSDLSTLAQERRWMEASPPVYCNPHQPEFPEYARDFFRWTREVPLIEIESRLDSRNLNVGTLEAIRVAERTASGRVSQIEAVGSARTAAITNGDTIRFVMGGLRSNFFAAESLYKDGKVSGYRFRGAGFGHGVGLCQIGAYMMAKRGYTSEEILKHYFTDVDLVKLYD